MSTHKIYFHRDIEKYQYFLFEKKPKTTLSVGLSVIRSGVVQI